MAHIPMGSETKVASPLAQTSQTGENKMTDFLQMKDALLKLLDDAIKNFDFKKTSVLCKVIGRELCSVARAPSEEDLKAQAQALRERAIFEFLIDNKATKCSTGGLQVSIFEWKHSYELSVAFIYENSSEFMSKQDDYKMNEVVSR